MQCLHLWGSGCFHLCRGLPASTFTCLSFEGFFFCLLILFSDIDCSHFITWRVQGISSSMETLRSSVQSFMARAISFCFSLNIFFLLVYLNHFKSFLLLSATIKVLVLTLEFSPRKLLTSSFQWLSIPWTCLAVSSTHQLVISFFLSNPVDFPFPIAWFCLSFCVINSFTQ